MPSQPEPEQPPKRSVIEPTEVIPRRRPRPLEDFRELYRTARSADRPADDTDPPAGDGPPPDAEDDTRELAPVGGPEPPVGRRVRLSAPGLAVALAAAATAGFAAAVLLNAGGAAPPAAGAPPSASVAPAVPGSAGPSDPDGPGVLRQGDTGPAVADLQRRLLRVPDVYQGGTVDGRYDATLAAAVARFQLWYGVRGDETGVYGDDTRRALESRT